MEFLTSDDLPYVARLLGAGRLVAVPTARWYMLCARAADETAISAVFRAKCRPTSKPLLLLLETSNVAQEEFHLSDDARSLSTHLWPGDLALRLPWRPDATVRPAFGAPALVGCPDGLLGRLLHVMGEPLAAAVCSISTPSAGAGDHPAITAGQVADFDRAVQADIAAVIDNGICPQAQHMTIVDCPADQPARLHRDGTVHARAVAAALAPGAPHVG